jgi:hypothetical protein
MTVVEISTLFVALAALIASVVSVLEMRRQRENDIRPVLVVLEKQIDSKDPNSPLVLYLVNMGQAVAMNTHVWWEGFPCDGTRPKRLQSEIFPGRRAELIRGYDQSAIDRVKIFTTYSDVNGNQYCTNFVPDEGARAHTFGRGFRSPPSGLGEYRESSLKLERAA